jgi:hypothetical protein
MGVYLVYYKDDSDNELDVFDFSYVLKPTDSVKDFFSNMDEIEKAIKEDEYKDFCEDGDTREYYILDLCTNTIKIVRATYCLTPSIIIE